MKIGVISDTHGYLNSKIFGLFAGVSHILHAGDIDAEEVIVELQVIAPVTAVHGNMDSHDLATRYPKKQVIEFNGVKLGLIHGDGFPLVGRYARMAKVFSEEHPQVIIFGHTHRAKIKWENSQLFFNPGAAGRGKFILMPSVGILRISEDGTIKAEVKYL